MLNYRHLAQGAKIVKQKHQYIWLSRHMYGTVTAPESDHNEAISTGSKVLFESSKTAVFTAKWLALMFKIINSWRVCFNMLNSFCASVKKNFDITYLFWVECYSLNLRDKAHTYVRYYKSSFCNYPCGLNSAPPLKRHCFVFAVRLNTYNYNLRRNSF